MKSFTNILELLYPSKCPFCGRILAEEAAEDGICPECRASLPWTGAGAVTRGSYFSSCVSPLNYRDGARQGLLRFKFRHRSAAGRCFGRLMARCVREKLPWEFDLVTYVPLSLLRFRSRGYSQSRLLAEALAAQLGLPCVRLLRKRRHTKPLSGVKGGERRRAVVSGAFCLRPGAEAQMAGKCVLLVDDVVTTGATLGECSRLLLTAGADRVACATLCKAIRK
jgi:ComF family protein